MKYEVRIKRIYDGFDHKDGVRILVDKLWPRGIKKEDAAIDGWWKEIAPSEDLRKWFGHKQKNWPAFRERYWLELKEKHQELESLLKDLSGKHPITLLYAAKATKHNNAIVLKSYLMNEVQ